MVPDMISTIVPRRRKPPETDASPWHWERCVAFERGFVRWNDFVREIGGNERKRLALFAPLGVPFFLFGERIRRCSPERVREIQAAAQRNIAAFIEREKRGVL